MHIVAYRLYPLPSQIFTRPLSRPAEVAIMLCLCVCFTAAALWP